MSEISDAFHIHWLMHDYNSLYTYEQDTTDSYASVFDDNSYL